MEPWLTLASVFDQLESPVHQLRFSIKSVFSVQCYKLPYWL